MLGFLTILFFIVAILAIISGFVVVITGDDPEERVIGLLIVAIGGCLIWFCILVIQTCG